MTAGNWNGRADDGRLSWELLGECALLLAFLAVAVLA